MPNHFNQPVIDEFRANHGQVGGPFEGARLVLLTTTGARTGTPHTTPVGFLHDGDGRILVIASAGGSPRNPDWYRNLVAHPRVTVESGAFTYEAEAVVLTGEERDRAFARAVEGDPGWADYQARTDRVIPVVSLREIPTGGPPNMNGSSLGEHVRIVHAAFRRELALIKEELVREELASEALAREELAREASRTEQAAEDGGGDRERPGARLGAQLRINCLTLCQGLHNHHTGEDVALFPFVGDRHPELAPVLARLRDEHERIAELLEDLREVVADEDRGADKDGGRDTGPGHVLREVERLTAELEAHLTYEEEQLLPVLDAATV